MAPDADPGAGRGREADRAQARRSWPRCRREPPLGDEEVDAIRAVGDNRGSMLLKGATPDHEGEERPDRWALGAEQAELAARWGIDPERDLRKSAAAA